MAAAVAVATLVVLPRPTSAAPAVSYPAALGQLQSPSALVADATATTGQVVQFSAPTADAAGFVHPGILLDPSQLSFVANQIAASGAPWTGALAALNPTYTNLSYVAHPAATVDCSLNASSCQSVLNDAIAAYTQALLYSYSTAPDRAKYANASIAIMNAWSATLRTASGNSARLSMAWAAETFPRAAEILRYTFTPGPTDQVLDVTGFTNMLNNVFEPTIVAGDGNSNGNWELAMADGLVSIGVFTDNRGVFNAGLAMWRARVPAYIYLSTDNGGSGQPVPPPGGLYNNPTALTCYWLGAGAVNHACTVPPGFQYFDGMTQETCRDLSHPIIGLESIVNAAETARLQGIDLYGEQKQRIAAAYEYAGAFDNQYLTNRVWPAVPCGGQPGSFAGQGGDGTGGTGYSFGWEIGYNEFANRLGLPMPNTQAMITRFRPTGGVNATVWETLANVGAAAPSGCTALDLRAGATPLPPHHPPHPRRRRRQLPAVGTHQTQLEFLDRVRRAGRWRLPDHGRCGEPPAGSVELGRRGNDGAGRCCPHRGHAYVDAYRPQLRPARRQRDGVGRPPVRAG